MNAELALIISNAHLTSTYVREAKAACETADGDLARASKHKIACDRHHLDRLLNQQKAVDALRIYMNSKDPA